MVHDRSGIPFRPTSAPRNQRRPAMSHARQQNRPHHTPLPLRKTTLRPLPWYALSPPPFISLVTGTTPCSSGPGTDLHSAITRTQSCSSRSLPHPLYLHPLQQLGSDADPLPHLSISRASTIKMLSIKMQTKMSTVQEQQRLMRRAQSQRVVMESNQVDAEPQTVEQALQQSVAVGWQTVLRSDGFCPAPC